MKRKQPTRPDLLERFDSLDVTGSAFERAVGLPRNWIAKLRQGGNGGDRSEKTIAKFEAAIAAAEAERRARRVGGAPKSATRSEPASPEEPSRGPGRPRSRVEEDVLKELLPKIRDADTTEKKDALLRHVLELAARGEIGTELARFCNDSIGQQRQLAKVRNDEDERARAGEPVKVEIVYVNDWRGARDDV